LLYLSVEARHITKKHFTAEAQRHGGKAVYCLWRRRRYKQIKTLRLCASAVQIIFSKPHQKPPTLTTCNQL
ncbi:MAG: hypothetical protein ACNYZG_08195, partial [Gammaproteobacteria bacterium]